MRPGNIEYFVSNVRNEKGLYLCSQSAEIVVEQSSARRVSRYIAVLQLS